MTKSIGEHWACSELARRGWAPALTRDGLSRTDVLAVGTHLHHRAQIEVQVKSATMQKSIETTGWRLGKVVDLPAQSDAEWFVLVAIPAEEHQPLDAFVMPRDHVAAGAYISHMAWRTEG